MGERAPLQYLTAAAYWRDMVLSVGPGVLIPRPETELMIDFAEEAVAANPALGRGQWVRRDKRCRPALRPQPRWRHTQPPKEAAKGHLLTSCPLSWPTHPGSQADLGTGSGALAVGLARALPDSPAVWAVDRAAAPLAYVAFNAARLGVADRVRPAVGSWYEPLLAAGVPPGSLAGVLSNPPYIPSAVVAGQLQAEVGRHEPSCALDGGEGLGVDALVPVAAGAVRLLARGGLLVLETGGGEQARYVADVLRRMRSSAGGPGMAGCAATTAATGGTGDGAGWAAGSLGEPSGAWAGAECGLADDERPAFEAVRIRRDLYGVDRFVTAIRAWE